MLVYDVSDLASFRDLDNLLYEIQWVSRNVLHIQWVIAIFFALLWYRLYFSLDQDRNYDHVPAVLLLVGNKSDLEYEREVSIEMGRQVGVSMFVSYLKLWCTCHQVHKKLSNGIIVLCCSGVVGVAICTVAHSCSLVSNSHVPQLHTLALTCGFLFSCAVHIYCV